MKQGNTPRHALIQRVLGMFVALVCALSLAGCVEGTPLEGTPVEGPLNTMGELAGQAVEKLGELAELAEGPLGKLGELLEGPLGKVKELIDSHLLGPSVEEAREAKASETAPALSADSLVTEGYLTVGLQTSKISAPLMIMGDEDSITGIDVDVASAVASELGLKVAFVSVDGIDSALAGKKCDVVMDASSDGLNTSTVLGGYYETAPSFFHLGAPGAVPVSDLEGRTVGVQTGSVSQNALASTGLNMKETVYQNLNEAFAALAAEEVDYVLCDAYPGAFLAANYVGVSFAGTLAAPSSLGIAASSDNAELQAAVKEALDTVMANGKMDVIRLSWLGGMDAVTVDDVIADIPAKNAENKEEGEGEPQDGSTAGANAVVVEDEYEPEGDYYEGDYYEGDYYEGEGEGW